MTKKPSETVERIEREALQVGLSRHRKPENKTPRWLVDYAGWIVAGAIFLFVLVPFGILGVGSGPETALRGPVAKLEVHGAPIKVWVEGSKTRLKSVQLKVANKGAARAEGVVISVKVDNKVFALEGATAIDSGRTENYVGAVDAYSEDGSVLLHLHCATCQ